ncbi:MAG: terpene cyclase/mutase family protein [Phycisphaerales bacterium]
MKRILSAAVLGVLCACAAAQDSLDERAERIAERAIEFLRTQQHESGGWAVRDEGPNFPAITGLAVTGMLLDPEINARDEHVAKGLGYILSHRQDDGGIYDRVLASYNTAICLSALALARDDLPEAEQSVEPAVAFLRELQWGGSANAPAALQDEVQPVAREHPFYGGVGYGSHSRPDNSNLNFWLQALQDAGVPGDDPAVQRALVFLERTQMNDSTNPMPYAEGSSQGGFIYATSPSSHEHELGIGESKAGTITESTTAGEEVSRLRAYGSMTYAGFKSYAFAQLERTDPRVLAARKWIAQNYTIEENPGMGTEGYYYFILVFGRAMNEWGDKYIDVQHEDMMFRRDWAEDLVTQLESLQQADGSFKVVDDRWMEADPVLVTSYSLISLQNAREALRSRQ